MINTNEGEKIDLENQAQIYPVKTILEWDLPFDCNSLEKIQNYKYLFITIIKNTDSNSNEYRFKLFPTNNSEGFYIEVELEQILPEILKDVLKYLKEYNIEILSSTGICASEKKCYFGVYFSISQDFNKDEFSELKEKLSKIENVLKVTLNEIKCPGCCF